MKRCWLIRNVNVSQNVSDVFVLMKRSHLTDTRFIILKTFRTKKIENHLIIISLYYNGVLQYKPILKNKQFV